MNKCIRFASQLPTLASSEYYFEHPYSTFFSPSIGIRMCLYILKLWSILILRSIRIISSLRAPFSSAENQLDILSPILIILTHNTSLWICFIEF